MPDSSIQKKWPIEKFNAFLDDMGNALRIMTISPSADNQPINSNIDDDIHSLTCSHEPNSTRVTKKSVSFDVPKNTDHDNSEAVFPSSYRHIQALIDRNIIVSLGVSSLQLHVNKSCLTHHWCHTLCPLRSTIKTVQRNKFLKF